MKGNGKDDEFDGIDEADLEELGAEPHEVLDDEASAELDEMIGFKVLALEMEVAAEEMDENEQPVPPEKQILFDCILYCEKQMALELYDALIYEEPSEEPVAGTDPIFGAIGQLSDNNLELIEFDQADDEGGLALAFGKGDKVQFVLVANAWMVSEWEEDAEEEDEDEV